MSAVDRISRWLAPVGLIVGAGVVLVVIRAGLVAAVVVLAVAVFAAWWVSPLRNPGGVHHTEAAHAAASDDAVVVYWRPGCPFCMRLRRGLGSLRGRALWVNIWADADAAAFVRRINDGNETVPTVVVGRQAVWTNPDPTRVREVLSARANAD